MNNLDFTLPGGFPLDQDVLDIMQGQSSLAAKPALLGGELYILEGGVQTGGTATAGTVVINGEVLPFDGGTVTLKVIVVEAITNLTYEDGVARPAQKVRKAVFGDDGVQNNPWADFKRNTPNNGVLARLDNIERMLKPLLGYTVSGTTYYGSWLFWGRPASEIPDGWQAVPDADWKGKVPVMLDATQTEFATVGQTGGVKSVTLTANQSGVQPHDHTFTGSGTTAPNAGLVIGAQQDNQTLGGTFGGSHPNTVVGGSKDAIDAHTNLQPYKVVLFIRFIG